MSFDLKLRNICEHRVEDELHFLDPDRRTVRLIRPPSNTLDFVLMMTGVEIESDHPKFGFIIEPDELRVAPASKLVFGQTHQDASPILEVSYTTDARNCRRCHGFRAENDFRFDNLGRLILAENEEKMIQDLMKFVLTVKSSNKFHPELGTGLLGLIGSKVFNLDQLRLEATRDVADSVTGLIRLQQRQVQYQRVTVREVIERLLSVDFQQQDENDPTLFDMLIAVESASGQIETDKIPLRIPGLSQTLSPGSGRFEARR